MPVQSKRMPVSDTTPTTDATEMGLSGPQHENDDLIAETEKMTLDQNDSAAQQRPTARELELERENAHLRAQVAAPQHPSRRELALERQNARLRAQVESEHDAKTEMAQSVVSLGTQLAEVLEAEKEIFKNAQAAEGNVAKMEAELMNCLAITKADIERIQGLEEELAMANQHGDQMMSLAALLYTQVKLIAGYLEGVPGIDLDPVDEWVRLNTDAATVGWLDRNGPILTAQQRSFGT